jgi:hypothetical protein
MTYLHEVSQTKRVGVRRLLRQRPGTNRNGLMNPRRSSIVEVDPHDRTALGRVSDLSKSRGGEDAVAADVQFAPGDVDAGLGVHRVCLKRPRSTPTSEIDRRLRQRSADALAAKPSADHEARHRPHATVAFVLGSTSPRNRHAEQPLEPRSRFDAAPTCRLAIKIGNEAAGRAGIRVPAIGLLSKSQRSLVDRHRAVLGLTDLVALTLTSSRITTCSEDELQIFPGRFIGRHDVDRRRLSGLGHRRNVVRAFSPTRRP